MNRFFPLFLLPCLTWAAPAYYVPSADPAYIQPIPAEQLEAGQPIYDAPRSPVLRSMQRSKAKSHHVLLKKSKSADKAKAPAKKKSAPKVVPKPAAKPVAKAKPEVKAAPKPAPKPAKVAKPVPARQAALQQLAARLVEVNKQKQQLAEELDTTRGELADVRRELAAVTLVSRAAAERAARAEQAQVRLAWLSGGALLLVLGGAGFLGWQSCRCREGKKDAPTQDAPPSA